MRAYQDLKDSGVEWLGKIPADWDTKRIGRLFSQRNEKVSDKDYEPLSVTKSGIVPQLEDAAKTNDGDNRKKVLKGDFVINSRSDRKGSSGLSQLDGSVSLINTVLTGGRLYPRYTHYLLRSYPFQEEFYRWGQGIVADLWSTNYERMKNIILPMPDKRTQCIIADFLDKETTKIDNLIAKQEKLLELLEEKRRATITNAVTRGLSPNAELKDTGIKWLGKIPSHWEMSKIKYVSRYFSGGYPLPKNSAEPETEPWVQISDITKNTLDKPKARISKKDINEVNIQKTVKDSLLFSFKMSVGRTAISPIDLYTTSEIATFLPSDKIQSRYAFYAYPFYIPKNAKKNMAGSDLMNLELIGTARICLPPVPEQKEIVTFLDNENKTLEQLKQKIEKQVDILKERRISLISKAVTGKIKV